MTNMRILTFPDGKSYEITDQYSRDSISTINNKISNLYTKTDIDQRLNLKQDALISGVTIKTINGQSLLSSGNISFPTNLSSFENDANFITSSVSSLTNFYNKQDINTIVANLKNDSYQVVQQLPLMGAEGILYLVGSGAPYQRYIWENNKFLNLGDTSINLDGYVKGMNLNDNYIVLGNGSSNIKSSAYTISSVLNNSSSELAVSSAIYGLLSGKQDTLISGSNIKTISGQSLLGSGNIEITLDAYTKTEVDNNFVNKNQLNSEANPNTVAYRDGNGRVKTSTPASSNDAVNLEYFTEHVGDTVYTNNNPTTSDIGGIPAGTTFDNMSIEEVFNKLFYPYVAAKLNSFIIKPNNGGTFEKGTSVSLTGATVSLTKGSAALTSLAIYDGDSKLTELISDINSSNTLTFSLSVTNNKQLRVELTDDTEKKITMNSSSFNFVYPYYYGALASVSDVNESNVKGLTKSVVAKGNRTFAYTLNNQIAIVAYPKSYGTIRQIKDSNGYDLTESFNVREISITGADSTAVAYYIYSLFQAATASTSYTFSF